MIHIFKRAGLNLVLDTGSGAVHVLDDISYDLLDNLTENQVKAAGLPENLPSNLVEKYGHENLESSFSEISNLYKSGLLYSEDDYSEFADALGTSPVKAMCLHIAHDCNLRCKYCFASTGEFGGQRKMMDFETAKKSIDMLIALSGNRRNLEVDFFGGEPLMNFQVVKDTVAYARSLEKEHNKNFRFTITTNGIGLNDSNIEFINEEMSNVVLSIDGRKEVNDKMRPKIDGRGSYDTILPKFQRLVDGRGEKEYYVRGTYTRFNTDFDKDVMSLYDAGFKQISVEPVVGPETDDYSIRQEDIPAIEQSYERLMNELIKRRKNKSGNFNFFHFMLDLDNGPCAIKRLKGCGSGNEYVAITPDGELYPCHQFVGNEKFIMGDTDNGITKPEMKQEFADANLLNKPECNNCWAKFFCSGGCNANNYNFRGTINSPYELACELEKIRLECSIAIQAAMSISEQ